MLHVSLVARTATDMKIIMFKVNITLTVTRVVETDRQTDRKSQSHREREGGRGRKGDRETVGAGRETETYRSKLQV